MVNRSRARSLYRKNHRCIPKPGTGNGCHTHLLRIANYGRMAGLTPNLIFRDIRQHIPSGNRNVPDSEIQAAISKAFGKQQRQMRQRKVKGDSEKARADFFKSKGLVDVTITETDIINASPITPCEEDVDNLHGLLSLLYYDNDLLFMGQKHELAIPELTLRTVAEWKENLCNGFHLPPPHIIPNPVIYSPNASTSRGDDTVAKRFAILEFDDVSQENQLRIFWGLDVPVVALIDSGNKSYHAWIRVDAANHAEWDKKVKRDIYQKLAIPLGADPACSHPSRLSRTPGAYRSGKLQRLLYLNPEGGRIGR
jgi:hypothetical protein